MKTYEQALKSASRAGAGKSLGIDHLAQTAYVLCRLHPGCSPKMIYDGAVKMGLSAQQLQKLANESPTKFGDLMFS